MGYSSVSLNAMGLPEFKPILLKTDHVKVILPAYLPIVDTLLNTYKTNQQKESTTENLANGVNNVLYVGSFLPTGLKAGAFIAMALGAGMKASQALVAVSNVMGDVLSPASYMVNAIVMGRQAVKASTIDLNLSRLKTCHYECNCHALGIQSTDPVTGDMRGATWLYGKLQASSIPACESLRQYAMKQVGKRADRNMVYASPLASSTETIRRMGKSLVKRVKGTKGKTRRFAAINLWGAARGADKKNELFATIWGDNELKCTLDDKSITLKEDDVAVGRLLIVRDWNTIWTRGCPLAIGIIHCLLGGDPGNFDAKDWQKTMTTIAAMDGWYVIEQALAST